MADVLVCLTPPLFKDLLIKEIPNLRAFAASLCGSMHLADDLVQDTLLKAWSHSDSFEEGTNIRAWLFTIPLVSEELALSFY
jgi:RNA polymerase sigma-70 factor (ECF subfamily)